MVEERVRRKLAAILAADVVGYSRLMRRDETGTLAALKEHRAALIDPTITAHNGRTVKLMGDGTLAEFASVVDAVECAAKLQQGMAKRNAGVPEDRRIELRIGVNLGDVIIDGDDIYGDGVNVAARLQGLADPGGICISGATYDAIENKLAHPFEFMGEREVKNIEKPVRAYRMVTPDASPGVPPPEPRTSTTSARQRGDKPSIALKPFHAFGADPDEANLADGLSNGIMAALTRVPGLILIGDESPSLVESKQMTTRKLGERFGVQYVLKGSVRKAGDRLRVTAELVEASTDRYVWADQLDRELRNHGDIFAIEDEIVEEIVTALDVKLFAGEVARLVRNALRSPAAREKMYRGEDLLWNAKSKLDLREAQRLFEEIIQLEPTSSVGYAQGALAYWSEVAAGLSDRPSEPLERATERAREAIKLDDATGYSHNVMAHVHLRNRAYDEALNEANHAVLERPSCPTAYSLRAAALNYLGRSAEAIEVAKFAERLTPVQPPDFPAILATAYYGAERHDEAIAAAKAAIEVDEGKVEPHLILAASNVVLGHLEEARRAAQIVLKLQPDFRLAEFAESQPYKEQKHLDRLLARLKSTGLK